MKNQQVMVLILLIKLTTNQKHQKSQLKAPATLANEKVKMTAIAANANPNKQTVKIHATIEIVDIAALDNIAARLQQIPNVLSVKRPLEKNQ